MSEFPLQTPLVYHKTSSPVLELSAATETILSGRGRQVSLRPEADRKPPWASNKQRPGRPLERFHRDNTDTHQRASNIR
jgi:hypothetical protein